MVAMKVTGCFGKSMVAMESPCYRKSIVSTRKSLDVMESHWVIEKSMERIAI
jgi:hypothetical protein